MFFVFFTAFALAAISLSDTARAVTDETGGTTYTNFCDGPGIIESAPITASASGALVSVGINHYTASGNCIMAIYDDDSNQPKNLLGQSGEISCLAGWQDFPITGVDIVEGLQYWLAEEQSTVAETCIYNIHDYRCYQVLTYGSVPDPFSPTGCDSNVQFNGRMIYNACEPDFTLNSTQNDCVNSTYYAYNTTYYDVNECDPENLFISNYTDQPLGYAFASSENNCMNSTTLNSTSIYNDVLSCGYSFSNSTFPTCSYGCTGSICGNMPLSYDFCADNSTLVKTKIAINNGTISNTTDIIHCSNGCDNSLNLCSPSELVLVLIIFGVVIILLFIFHFLRKTWFR